MRRNRLAEITELKLKKYSLSQWRKSVEVLMMFSHTGAKQSN